MTVPSLFVLVGCLADLRPDELSDQPDDGRGRALLEAAAEAHGGLGRWSEIATTELVFRDTWRGPARLLNPWPSAEIRARIVQRTRTFDSVVTFLDEDDSGLVWGIDQGEAWWIQPGETRQPTTDGDVRFMLPTVQYFVEMPFRLLEAELVRYAGPERVDGVSYERVFVTWRSIEPNADFDQYVVYLDPETGRLARVDYTVREILGAATGSGHFEDLRQVDGIWIPHRIAVSAVGDPAEAWIHDMVIETLRFDSHDRDGLTPKPGIEPLR